MINSVNINDNISFTQQLTITNALDYIYQNLSIEREEIMEAFLDRHEQYDKLINQFLDFCLDRNLNRIAVEHLLKTGASTALNQLASQFHKVPSPTPAKETISVFNYLEQQLQILFFTLLNLVFNQHSAKLVFTLALFINMPCLLQNENASFWFSSQLKASTEEVIKENLTITDFEIRHMGTDMSDNEPLTHYLTIVALPTEFEKRYIVDN